MPFPVLALLPMAKGFLGNWWKQIVLALVVILVLTFAWKAVTGTLAMAEDRGYQRGRAEVEAAYAKRKTDEVEQLSTLVNKIVGESQAAAARIETSVNRAGLSNRAFLDQLQKQNKPLVNAADCSFTDDFMSSWDVLRRAK